MEALEKKRKPCEEREEAWECLYNDSNSLHTNNDVKVSISEAPIPQPSHALKHTVRQPC